MLDVFPQMPCLDVKSEFRDPAPGGERFELFTLETQNGCRMRVMNYGAIVLSLEAPDRMGNSSDVVLGLNTPEGYLAGTPFSEQWWGVTETALPVAAFYWMA